ncbi:MAG: hypothetical protein ABJM11_21190 [Marinobacter sp.]|uniref:hypothetical protein n=1 Tax=Marinobacter sp. TaxID=50741 RepID=UPI00329A78FC
MRKSLLMTVTGLTVFLIAMSPQSLANDAETVALTVDGITRHTGDDDPAVLYILPWQPPTLPRRTRAELEAGNDELLEPKDPLTLERHRRFRETLNPSLDSTLSLQ